MHTGPDLTASITVMSGSHGLKPLVCYSHQTYACASRPPLLTALALGALVGKKKKCHVSLQMEGETSL